MEKIIRTKKQMQFKKTQTEVLGFAMVVLLVSVGMLFIISFLILKQDTDIK